MFWTTVLEKTLESPLDCKEIQPVHPKQNQSWIFIQMTDVETEAPILWPPDAKNWLIRKYPDAGNSWRQEEKGLTEGEMVGCHHWLSGHELEQATGDGEGQGSLECWVHGVTVSDMTERLNSKSEFWVCVLKHCISEEYLTLGMQITKNIFVLKKYFWLRSEQKFNCIVLE